MNVALSRHCGIFLAYLIDPRWQVDRVKVERTNGLPSVQRCSKVYPCNCHAGNPFIVNLLH